MGTNNFEQAEAIGRGVVTGVADALRAEAFAPSAAGRMVGKEMEHAITGGAGLGVGAAVAGILELKNPFDMSDPFKQDYEQSHGIVDDVIKGFKRVFGQEHSMEDEIKQHTEKQMSKEPATDGKGGTKADQLHREQELYDSEVRKAMADLALLYVGRPLHELPKLDSDPRFATIRERNERAEQTEKQIQTKVAKDLGPTVMKDIQTQMDEYNDSFKIRNPAGTGEGFRQHTPGPLLDYYWKKVREQTHKTLEN